MKTNRVSFAGVELSLPEPWCDITDDLESGSPPTLARGPNGCGVLQFSVAKYKGGRQPEIRTSHLEDMLDKFAESHGLINKRNVRRVDGKQRLISADFTSDSDFVRVYYVSDGSNVVMVTYLCDASNSQVDAEVTEADTIVRSLSFPGEAKLGNQQHRDERVP